jgi:transposase-like protein
VLPRFARKSEAVKAVIPELYLEGLSTRDFRRALRPLWNESGLSRSSVSRCNAELKKGFEAWRRRDLSGEELLVLFADGFYVGMRRGTSGKDALLVAHGVRKDGTRVVLGMAVGGRESTEAWKLLFNDLRSRGLRAPQLLVVDGNPGLLRAARDVFSESALQRCIVHRMRNVLSRVPLKHQAAVRTDLRTVFYAACEDDALAAAAAFARKHGETFTGACEVLGTDLADCLAFYRFPEKYWKRIRTTNVIERAFREVRRRADVIGRFPDETSAMFLAWGVLEHARVHWHNLRVKPADVVQITEARRSLQEKPIEVRGFEELIAA